MSSDTISPIGFMQANRAARAFVDSIDAIAAGMNDRSAGGSFSIEDERARHGREQYPHGMLSSKPPTPFEEMRNAHAKPIQAAHAEERR